MGLVHFFGGMMRKLTQITTLIAVLALFAAPAFSDTLVLKNGEKISGFFEGGSARVIKFRTTDGLTKDYDLLTVKEIQFGEEKTATSHSTSAAASTSTSATTSTPPATAAARSNDSEPRLLSNTERVTRPTSSNAA